MIVVHPYDPSTRFLSLIYEDIPGVKFFDSFLQKDAIISSIKEAPGDEPILLLGHGSLYGLCDFRTVGPVIGDTEAGILRDRPNLCGIWCHASVFAHFHDLKGFFSGMFVSEYAEALDEGVQADPGEIEDMNWDFAGRFGELLREGLSMEEIARRLSAPALMTSDLTEYNYRRLTYRKTGLEPLPERDWLRK